MLTKQHELLPAGQ